MKREFKDLVIYEPYELLNSEITGDYDKSHAVTCVNGTFVGCEEHGVASWLGIPFAKPPVGERRFKAPEYADERPQRPPELQVIGGGHHDHIEIMNSSMRAPVIYFNVVLSAR